MKKQYLIFILLYAGILSLPAQTPVKSFDEFFVTGMKKLEGVFPVYVAEKEVYLEIPAEYAGREIELSGHIDRGFDLLHRPVKGLGVARISFSGESVVSFRQPFYAERILDENSQYQRAFSLSNVQSNGKDYPIVAYSEQHGAILRITDYLLNEDDWFSYDYSFIRSQVPELSEIIKIHPFEEGVSFTVRRYHGVDAERYMFSSSAVMLPEGSMPLEVTCVMRLLPQKKDRIRLADSRMPYQTLHFKDYSQDPYCSVEDSLILRWDLSKPLTFYVDTLFPKEYFQAVRKGILVWNEAFRKAGIQEALQVKYADNRIVPAEQRAFVSYDLRMAGVKSDFTCHPRTGEILSCCLNIGHGFQKDMLDDYLLKYGATDPRVIADRFSKEVEKELLQSEITKEVGHLLGLRRRLAGNSLSPRVLKVGESGCQAIYFGYSQVKGCKNCYQEREKLHHWIPENENIYCSEEDYATAISHLQTVVSQLDKIVYKGKERDKGSALTDIYRKAIRLYGTYLIEIATKIGSSQPPEIQRQAMLHLDNYLFHPHDDMECAYVKRNLLEERNKILYPDLVKLFKQLLSIETLSALRLQSFKESGKGYDDKAFFKDLYQGLFNSFDPSVPIKYEQIDIQRICIDVWLASLQERTEHTGTVQCLKNELHTFYDRLKSLSETHHQPEVRDMYTFFTERIKKCLYK